MICTWPDFTTLGICSECADVTRFTQVWSAVKGMWDGSVLLTTPKGPGLLILDAPGGTKDPMGRLGSEVAVSARKDIDKDAAVILDFAYAQEIPEAVFTGGETPYVVTECQLKWCAKVFRDVKSVNRSMQYNVTDLQLQTVDPPDYGCDVTHCLSPNTTTTTIPPFPYPHSLPDITFHVRDSDSRTLASVLINEMHNDDAGNSNRMLLYHPTNVSAAAGRIAAALTDIVRRNGDLVIGEYSYGGDCVVVGWYWVWLVDGFVLLQLLMLLCALWRR
ncbi:hypothetical protein DBV05_g8995 [Lasiodiplodia theobromae]|uniref:Uncharacterized protein n=2 Tax=Lasiodiplodia theobromae TaxID=45133 RepID=A0A5N5D3V1_9PEZI|nr:hypothetical protein DBV05_g8995 [Lasiodiplodia theobromae]